MVGARKWFHPYLSGVDSERLLREKGFDGSFLVRPSKSNPGDFTLTVRRTKDSITHVKIQNSGDYLDLYGGEKFATLGELIEYYMEHVGQLREKNGDVIELKYPLLTEDPTEERWFHPHIGGQEAERILMENGKVGSFLVRTSTTRPGDYVMSVRTDTSVTHVIVQNSGGKYSVGGGNEFESLTALVEHYKQNPMVETSGNLVTMTSPVNATRVSAVSIANRVKVLSKTTDNVFGKPGFWEEFEQLQQAEAANVASMPRDVGAKPENRKKNRYRNILPFDDTRVKLRTVDPKVEGSDYINANFCGGLLPGKERQYIAAQGPLQDTVNAFWQMIHEAACSVILMTTNELEGSKNKCAHYWPDVLPQKFGHIRVEPLNRTVQPHFTLREFAVETGAGEDRHIVRQYHFTSWPDHATPKDPGTVLNYLQVIREYVSTLKDPGPILVHCSAGIGRTGTCIAINSLVELIEAKGLDVDIDIRETIQKLRLERSGMVQTESQYSFVYMAVMQHVETLKKRVEQERASASSNLYCNIASAHKETSRK